MDWEYHRQHESGDAIYYSNLWPQWLWSNAWNWIGKMSFAVFYFPLHWIWWKTQLESTPIQDLDGHHGRCHLLNRINWDRRSHKWGQIGFFHFPQRHLIGWAIFCLNVGTGWCGEHHSKTQRDSLCSVPYIKEKCIWKICGFCHSCCKRFPSVEGFDCVHRTNDFQCSQSLPFHSIRLAPTVRPIWSIAWISRHVWLDTDDKCCVQTKSRHRWKWEICRICFYHRNVDFRNDEAELNRWRGVSLYQCNEYTETFFKIRNFNMSLAIDASGSMR